MTKQNSITKILICLFALVLALGVCGSFVGCQSNEDEGKNSLNRIYLQVFDNQGNNFYLGKDNTTHEKDLEYEYKSDELKFTTKAFYENGEECLAQTFISFKQNTIHLDEPGVYNIQQIYKDTNDLDIIFKLNITVKELPDTRPVPRIEILPDENCVSYEMNKRYVYKYNGERHMPKYCKAYDPETPEIMIAMLEVRACAVDAEIIEGSENNSLFEDIGIYKFDLLVDSPSSGIGGEGQHYAPAKIFDIIVEIIK